MPNHPLFGAELRLQRADRHLAEADELIAVFSRACENNIVSDDDFKTIKFPFAEIRPELALVVSDANAVSRIMVGTSW